MSSASIVEAQLHSNNSDNSIERKDVVVSIILSESTASLLGIDAPNLQDILSEESSTYDLASSRSSGQGLKQLFMRNRDKDVDYINVDEVYFSRNFSSTSTSLSTFNSLNDTETEVIAEETMEALPIMEKYKVYTRPLLSAKTTAHEDRLKCKSNNIYVSIMESELTITSSGWVNFCRICHGGESVANLITPCRCRGSIALAHLQCLEEWLKQSANSRCELCQHHYEIIREPKYNILWSIIVFLTHPGDRLKEVLLDLLGFLIYTPTAIASTYLLMVLCDNIAMKHHLQYSRNFTSHFLAFAAVFGMATIDFTYSSWLVVMFQRHLDAWKEWYQNNCTLRLLLPPRKLRKHNRRILKQTTENQVD
ncbi:RING-variant domain [Popillia japonica]|uniref:RING-variant domain n=1 Tax=Popillia japonica TaxID=7064 RepID=A0AAW1J176_POPJA